MRLAESINKVFQAPRDASVRTAWLDDRGSFRIAQARVLGIWEDRIRLELPGPPHKNTMVRLLSDKLKLNGHARLLWHQRSGSWHHVELEFVDGLRWEPLSQSRLPAETSESEPTGTPFFWDWNFAGSRTSQ